jgi:hypothetical protein
LRDRRIAQNNEPLTGTPLNDATVDHAIMTMYRNDINPLGQRLYRYTSGICRCPHIDRIAFARATYRSDPRHYTWRICTFRRTQDTPSSPLKTPVNLLSDAQP